MKTFEKINNNTFKPAQKLNEEEIVGMGPDAIIDAVESKIISPEQAKILLKKYFKSSNHTKDSQVSAASGCVY